MSEIKFKMKSGDVYFRDIVRDVIKIGGVVKTVPMPGIDEKIRYYFTVFFQDQQPDTCYYSTNGEAQAERQKFEDWVTKVKEENEQKEESCQ